jgi:GntR family transcriptional repressor for pyruvate dehydrogenase complex
MENPSDFLIHDMLFHRIASQASNNPILVARMETITSSMYEKRRKSVEHSIDLRVIRGRDHAPRQMYLI